MMNEIANSRFDSKAGTTMPFASVASSTAPSASSARPLLEADPKVRSHQPPCLRVTRKLLLRLLHFSISLYVTLLLLLDPRSIVNDDFEGTLKPTGYAYLSCSIFCMLFYFVLCNLDPGIARPLPVDEGNKNFGDGTKFYPAKHYCHHCRINQPVRTRHCYDCGKCVKRFDHHCIWLDTCIGERNHTLYLVFLILEEGLVILSLVLVVMSMTRLAKEETVTDWMWHVSPYFISLLILVPSVVVLVCLTVYHFYLATQNTTTWELSSRYRITYLQHLPEYLDPFSSGFIGNLRQFFCEMPYNSIDWEEIYAANIKIQSLKN